MKKEFLFKVDDTFLIGDRGLILTPHLELPSADFKSFTGTALIELSDGTEVKCKASFETTHSILLDGRREWKLAIVIQDMAKEKIPIGSRLYVDSDTLSRIRP
jgi:hypothetical protein